MLILEERDGQLVHEFAVDTPADQPLLFDEPQTDTGDATPLNTARTYQWIHSLSRILGALFDAGLTLDFLHEHLWLPWRPFPLCVPCSEGYRLPECIPAFPLSISLRARKPASSDQRASGLRCLTNK
jgi:hypothetical protein